MSVPLAVAGTVEGITVLAAAAAAAVALLAPARRVRAAAMAGALLLAGVALAALVGAALTDAVAERPLPAAAAALAGAVAVIALAVVVHRRPAALALLVLAALPFRIPIPIGDDSANLLVPLYAVIAAGCLARLAVWRRGATAVRTGEDTPEVERDRRVRRLRGALATVLVLYAVQSLYSPGEEEAIKNLAFFYVPFALLLRLLLDVPWSRDVLVAALRLTAGLAVVFAIVGIVEYATGHLLISNAKVLDANELKPYFRVNSLFFDPNVFGRFLALTMVVLSALLLWSRRSRDALLVAAVLAVLWGGLVLSLSQSSFGALLTGLAVLAAVRWRPGPVVAVVAAGAVIAVVAVVLAGSSVGLDTRSERALDRATSGRVDLVRGALEMLGDRPVWGFGSGSFREVYREREDVRSERIAAISHTTPLTVAAEQGVLGLAAYALVLWAALGLLLGGLRRAVRREDDPGVLAITRAAVAAAFCGLVVHTFVYASFLEDPATWVLLAVGAAIVAATREPVRHSRRAVPAAEAERPREGVSAPAPSA